MKSVVNLLDKIEKQITTESFKNILKSITFVNGTEFRDFPNMSKSINGIDKTTIIFYVHSYCTYERGSSENRNRMMRKYFPKRTSFIEISLIKILNAANKINFSVRRLLNKKSAAETLKDLDVSIYNTLEVLGLKNPYINYYAS